tara:strand:+ start:133 stop:447 length:315 start_codon:yes stop_codon:yes gene_type:complete
LTNTDTLLKAAINRLTARFGEKIIDTAAEVASLAKEAPDKLQKEWETLKEEIYEEAERLKKEIDSREENQSNIKQNSDIDSPVERIDQIRARVSEINQKIDDQD